MTGDDGPGDAMQTYRDWRLRDESLRRGIASLRRAPGTDGAWDHRRESRTPIRLIASLAGGAAATLAAVIVLSADVIGVALVGAFGLVLGWLISSRLRSA